MSYTITRTNYLEANTVPLSTPAWWIRGFEPSIQKRTLRGSSLMLPKATGRRRRRRYIDENVYQFELIVRGLFKWDGTTYSNASDGFNANCEYLFANLGLASSTAVPFIWHRTDTTTKTASGDIDHLEFADLNGRDGKGVLEICVPSGFFS